MASNLKMGIAARNAMCDALVDRWDADTIAIRTGAPPATPATADSGTLLGTATFGTPAHGAAGAVTDGKAESNAVTSDTNADASGDAGHFRVNNGGVVDLQGTAGELADTPDLEFDNKTIVAGGTIAVSGFDVTMPET